MHTDLNVTGILGEMCGCRMLHDTHDIVYCVYVFLNYRAMPHIQKPLLCLLLGSTRDITNFTFENTTTHCENYVVLLGIEIDHSLTFNTHIANICKKAARQLADLQRLGHLLTRQGKLAMFKSLITSNFNYCPLIWHFVANLAQQNFRREHFDLFTMIIHPRIMTF